MKARFKYVNWGWGVTVCYNMWLSRGLEFPVSRATIYKQTITLNAVLTAHVKGTQQKGLVCSN